MRYSIQTKGEKPENGYPLYIALHGGGGGPAEMNDITYKGELLPCCVWQGKGLVKGNVFERSLYELWHSTEIQRYRKELVEEGCEVGCFNHSLYEYQESTRLSFRLSQDMQRLSEES